MTIFMGGHENAGATVLTRAFTTQSMDFAILVNLIQMRQTTKGEIDCISTIDCISNKQFFSFILKTFKSISEKALVLLKPLGNGF